MELLNQILTNILIFFITAVLIVVGNALRSWLNAKMIEAGESGKSTVLEMLYQIVKMTVEGIEQMYNSGVWTSEDKKQQAIDQVSTWVKQNGYDSMISEELISSVIEACVKQMNEDKLNYSDES